ncbi:MAG: PaaI family thioesterase, partial [Parvularculaceae bacterium]|nr:PaaI family thioesterase [Parvularculaceae bacterium]
KLTAAEITALFEREFPSWNEGPLLVESAGFRYGVVRMRTDERNLRPGGTVSGPTMFMLADTALYVAVLASVGPKLLSVTTSLTINFLRKPDVGDLVAECKLVKLGKRLAVGDVMIRPDSDEEAVAHAVGTYSIPV